MFNNKQKFYIIKIDSFSNKIINNIKVSIKQFIALITVTIIIIKEKPDIIIGFGSYASLPTLVASIILQKKLVLQEQNAVPGKAQRLFSRYAQFIATGFPDTKFPQKAKVIYTGNPVRKEISNIVKKSKDQDSFNIFIVGGSQGARIFSDIVPDALVKVQNNTTKVINVIHQCRPEDISRVSKIYSDANLTHEVKSFFDNMPEILSKSDLVICRAGAMTITENLVSNTPGIYVPLPNSANDHQMKNALFMSENGSGIIIPQNEFDVNVLSYNINEMINNENTLQRMKMSMQNIAKPNSTGQFIDLILDL